MNDLYWDFYGDVTVDYIPQGKRMLITYSISLAVLFIKENSVGDSYEIRNMMIRQLSRLST
jgi:hypothetical protein